MAFLASIGRSPSLWCLVLVVTILPCLGLHNGVARYRHFDDYLRNMDSEERAIITDESSPDGAGSDAESSITTTPPTTPSWENQRDITCCMLGQIAGDKGYHCFAKFYAARLRMRNRNRAHNRKMGFYGRNRIPDYGHRLMRTFEQCVVGDHGTIFHKCCHMVALERRDRVRYDTSASSAGRSHSAASAAEPESSASQQGESSASQHEREMNRYHHPHHRQHRTQEADGESVEVTTTTTESPRHQRVHHHRSSDDDVSTDTGDSRR